MDETQLITASFPGSIFSRLLSFSAPIALAVCNQTDDDVIGRAKLLEEDVNVQTPSAVQKIDL